MTDHPTKKSVLGFPDVVVWFTFTISVSVFFSAFFSPLSFSLVRLISIAVVLLLISMIVKDRRTHKQHLRERPRKIRNFNWCLPPIALICLSLYFRLNSGFHRFLPPNHDAMHHINQIDHIIRFNSLGLESIYGNTSGQAIDVAPRFYPHSSHAIVALFSFFNVDASSLVTYATFLMVSVMMPLGLYLMFISFDFGRVAAVIITMFVLSIGIVPNGPLSWGGIPTLYGLVLFPIWIAWLNSDYFWTKGGSQEKGPLNAGASLILLKISAGSFALFLVHPSSGFLFALLAFSRFIIEPQVGKPFKGLLLISIFVMLFLPKLAFLPGSGTVEEIGNTAPFYGDVALQAGQILLLSPNTVFRYWHLAIIPVLLVALMFQDALRPDRWSQQTEMARLRRRWSLLLVGGIWVLQLSVLTLNIPSFSGFSWASSLWYRQYARTAYHLPLAVGLLVGFAFQRLQGWRPISPKPRTERSNGSGLALAFLLLLVTFVAGIRTQRAHSESVQAIGPLSSQELEELVGFFEGDVDFRGGDLFLAADFNSGGSLLSIALNVPSDAEPYGRPDVIGGLHSLLSAGASLEELHGYSSQFGDVIVMTNSAAPGGSMSDEVFSSSGAYRRLFGTGGITLWKLRETAVSVGGDLVIRTDLFGGSPVLGLYGAETDSMTVQVEAVGRPPFELSERIEILQPPCETSGWKVVLPKVSEAGEVDLETSVLDDRVLVDISGTLSGTSHEFPITINVGSACTLIGDTQPALAFVLAK